MNSHLANTIIWLLGTKAIPDLTEMRQICLRGVVVFIAALIIVRVGHKRFFGKYSAFDLILSLLIGSTLSRAINGSAPLVESLVVSLLLVGLHWAVSLVTYHFHRLSPLLKGEPRTLVEEGKVKGEAMRSTRITEGDLMEALRMHGKTMEIQEVRLAILERNGEISVIPVKKKS